MERRVVITGLGAVSPVGLTAAESWESLKAGVSGIGLITHFDTTDFKVKVAAELKGFDPLAYLSKQEARHADRNVQYAIAAADQAVADAGLVIPGSHAPAAQGVEGEQGQDASQAPEPNIEAERLGVYVGSGIGGFETMSDQIIKFHEGGPRKVSPFMIPMMIANMASGMVVDPPSRPGPHPAGRHRLRDILAHGGRGVTTPSSVGVADAILAGGTEASRAARLRGRVHQLHGALEEPRPRHGMPPLRRQPRRLRHGRGRRRARARGATSTHASAGAKIYAEVVGYGNTADAYHMTSPDPNADGIARAVTDRRRGGAASTPPRACTSTRTAPRTTLNDASETKGHQARPWASRPPAAPTSRPPSR